MRDLMTTKKYMDRPSPPYPANKCKGLVMKGNDGKLYESVADKNSLHRWKLSNTVLPRKSRRSTRKSRPSTRKSRKSRRSTRKSRKSRKSRRSTRKSRRSTRKSRRSTRKSGRSTRKSRRSTRKSTRKSRRSTRKSRRSTRHTEFALYKFNSIQFNSRKSSDEKIKEYFRKVLKKYDDYLFPSVWTHPITGKQVKTTDKTRELFEEVKREINVKGKRCNVKKSTTNNRKDLIKELRSYVKCWEKKTGRNQDLSMERLNTESLADIKKHLKFYRDNNIL